MFGLVSPFEQNPRELKTTKTLCTGDACWVYFLLTALKAPS